MDQFAWSQRPLLVFAPSPADSRYRAQRQAKESTQAAFEERDMVWVEVFAEGERSRAGETPLGEAAARELRQRFGVDKDAFAVLLIGKDTAVKRRASEPVSMAAIYEQIDRMPMRCREMDGP